MERLRRGAGLECFLHFCVVEEDEFVAPDADAVKQHPSCRSVVVRPGTTLLDALKKIRNVGRVDALDPEAGWMQLEPELLSGLCLAGDTFYLKCIRTASVPAAPPPVVAHVRSGMESEDPTYSIIQHYQLKELPPLHQLEEWVVTKPDGLVFPIADIFFEAFRSVNSEIRLFEREHDGLSCTLLSLFLRPFLMLPPTGHTEASYIHFWESLISDIIGLFCVRSVLTDRDTNLDSNTSAKRPDRLMFVGNIPVGRAEEKRPGISAAIPLQELRDKTEWRYGGVPYLLAYSAIGGSVTFVALHSRDPSTREVLTKQLVTLDLFQLRDRIRLLVVLFNIARLFPVLSRLCIEYDVEADYLPATTSGDKTVQLQAKNVVKTYKDYDTYCTVFNIYEAIKDVPRVEICTTQRIIQARKRNRSLDYSLTFVPRVTFRQRARPLNNLLPALVQVAKTLNELHNRGWVHRDVHWRNIGKFGGDWYLIDFDEAAMVPCMEPHLLCEDAHAPEMRTGEHGYPVDVWSIGHLIATSKVRCDGGLLQLQDECLSEDPSSRPTMRQVLYRLQELPALLALMGKV
ncbi:uncharacterized protein LOC9648457 [Selaginella moellendorffii]|nr:uncharacterized protein LOC9648457 [Selaginella moellendorffii]|eukprot:XP_024523645.1 uncharacterized protein LOC9648457 [Selaginella moellendorffii]